MILTCPHYTSIEDVDIVEPVQVLITKSSNNIVTNLATSFPSLLIKFGSDIFVITIFIPIGMIHRFTTFSVFYVMQVLSCGTIQAIEKVSRPTNTPRIWPINLKKVLKNY
jgi:hypothetical protein